MRNAATTSTLLAGILAGASGLAQTAPWRDGTDMVVLRDGTELVGRSLAVRLGEYVKLRLPSGSVRVVLWSDLRSARGPSFDVAEAQRIQATAGSAPARGPVDVQLLVPHPGAVPLRLDAIGPPLTISTVSETPRLAPPVDLPPDVLPPTPFGQTLVTEASPPPVQDAVVVDVQLRYACTTPCTLYVRPGRIRLHLGGPGRVQSTETIETGPRGRRALLYSSSAAAFSTGLVLSLTGASLTLVGGIALLSDWAGVPSGIHAGPLAITGGVLLGLGVISLAAGLPIALRTRVGVARTAPLDSVGARVRWTGPTIAWTPTSGTAVGTAFAF